MNSSRFLKEKHHMQSMVRVALVDRRRLVAECLRDILVPRHINELTIHAHLQDLEAIIADGAAVDVILLGCHRASDADLEIGEALLERFQGRVALLCDFMPLATSRRLLTSKLNGFIQTSMKLEEFGAALRQISDQKLYIPPDYIRAALGEKELPYCMSERQLSVLNAIVSGTPNADIARQLDVSDAVIKGEVRAICQKLGVRNRTQAAMKAVQEGIA